jgi:hypothetical protein
VPIVSERREIPMEMQAMGRVVTEATVESLQDHLLVDPVNRRLTGNAAHGVSTFTKCSDTTSQVSPRVRIRRRGSRLAFRIDE